MSKEEIQLTLTIDEFVNLISMMDHNEFCERKCKDKPGQRTCYKCPVQSLFDKLGDAEDAI